MYLKLRPRAAGLRLRFRRKGPQDRIRGEPRANRGCEVGVQEAGRLGGWAGGHERGSSAGRGEQLECRIRLGVARVRSRARAIRDRFRVRKSAGFLLPGICTTRY